MNFAHNKFLGHVTKVCENGVLETANGSIPVVKGELIFTNGYGQQEIITNDYFQKHYVPVKKMTEEEIEKAYVEMADTYLEEANAGIHTYLDGMWTNKPC